MGNVAGIEPGLMESFLRRSPRQGSGLGNVPGHAQCGARPQTVRRACRQEVAAGMGGSVEHVSDRVVREDHVTRFDPRVPVKSGQNCRLLIVATTDHLCDLGRLSLADGMGRNSGADSRDRQIHVSLRSFRVLMIQVPG